MQPNLFPFGSVFGNPFLLNADLGEDGVRFGFESSRLFFLVPFLLLQGGGGGGDDGGMDLSKVGEKILSSVRSARSLGLLPPTVDRPEVCIYVLLLLLLFFNLMLGIEWGVTKLPISKLGLAGKCLILLTDFMLPLRLDVSSGNFARLVSAVHGALYSKCQDWDFGIYATSLDMLLMHWRFMKKMVFIGGIDVLEYHVLNDMGSLDAYKVPARAAAAAAVARVLAGMPPHQRFNLPSSSEELQSIYGSRIQGHMVEELGEDFYEEDFDPVRHILEHVPSEENELMYFEEQSYSSLLPLTSITIIIPATVGTCHFTTFVSVPVAATIIAIGTATTTAIMTVMVVAERHHDYGGVSNGSGCNVVVLGEATLRIAQLDRVAERLSHHVMEHHEVMVKGMNLVREVEKDLKVANVICMNGRRHLTSSMNEVSRDLVVNSNSKKKKALLDMLPLLTELRRALEMQKALESLVEEGNYCKAFQVLSEYLQLLDSFSGLSAIQEMSRGVEVWLGRTLQKLDALLLGVCEEFKEESYITVVDAYALIGDISGLAEKLQSFFMQEVLSESHSVLKIIVHEDLEIQMQNNRLTYSDLCHQIPESKFRMCLLRTLAILFRLMCSYHEIMSFQLESKDLVFQASDMKQDSLGSNGSLPQSVDGMLGSSSVDESTTTSMYQDCNFDVDETKSNGGEAPSSGSPWYHLRKEATTFVSQTLQRGRKNLWQLTTSRVSVLLSSAVIRSMSVHQFLKNYDDLNVFILAGEAFCGVEAIEFRQKLKAVCENYLLAFHQQNIHALKMVMEKESWLKLPPDTVQVISFAGLVGDGAALIVPSHDNSSNAKLHHSNKSLKSADANSKKSGFSSWIRSGNPFSPKLIPISVEGHSSSLLNGAPTGEYDEHANDTVSPQGSGASHKSGMPVSEDENEDLLADFIDEDSQLPSRISKPKPPKSNSSHCKTDEISAQTGSSLCLLRSMDKYARFMQKLEIVNVEVFKGICQLFEIFFYFVFETFAQQTSNSSGKSDSLNYRLKTAISRITQDCDQWIKPQLTPVSSSSPTSSSTHIHGDVTPASPSNHLLATSFGLKCASLTRIGKLGLCLCGERAGVGCSDGVERCAAADAISLVAQILHRSKTHLQSMLLQNNPAIVEDFFVILVYFLVDSVPDLTEHIHRTTARLLLHING
ncbi:hypothetical protein POTOM_033826 [Populus tomentosa]|uniref:Vacuolar protein sorting-associated protein 54 N-terminal domain-containing protein n=1 Tax=Populus tomentosa TaxID=118781 RepID=A0A8X7Z1J4_POPTO|nr:hypothetical protein POTOM_033826 [Populus tomentosa]